MDALKWLYRQKRPSQETRPCSWAHPRERSHPRVLIIEDDPEMAVGLQEFLKYEGYDIQIAQSGAEALPFLEVKSLRPDVVLLDLWIPGINGFELLGKFLGPPSGPEIPVIALSGDPIALEVARHRGIVASFSKPVHLDALLDTIQIFCPSSSRQAPRSKVV